MGQEGSFEGKKGALKPKPSYELWYTDGVRFDLLPTVAYTYRRRGEAQRIPTPGKNLKVAVSGALRWPDGPFVFSRGEESLNSELFIRMLRQLWYRVRRTGRWIILVMDRGPEHISHRSQEEMDVRNDRILAFELPPYTSEELNGWIEGLWKHLKEDYFSRMLVRDRRDFPWAVERLLKQMTRGHNWRKVLKPRLRSHIHQNLVGFA